MAGDWTQTGWPATMEGAVRSGYRAAASVLTAAEKPVKTDVPDLPRGLVARLINQFSDARCELLGILLNRPRGTAGGYLKKNYATMAEYSAQSAA